MNISRRKEQMTNVVTGRLRVDFDSNHVNML